MSSLSLTYCVDPMPFKKPLRIAGHVFEGIPAVRVKLTDGVATGRGEASGVYYTGDTVENICAELENSKPLLADGIDRMALRSHLPASGARNALDAALWDIEATTSGITAWKRAGLRDMHPLVTTFTLSADRPAEMLEQLEGYRDARAIKLKLDGNLEADAERIRLVYERRPDVWFMVDANQGYSVDRLSDLASVLHDAKVKLVEQPVPRGQEEGLEFIRLGIPLAADESLLDLGELDRLVGRFQVANIKLDKCGGLTEALEMRERARTLGLRTMVGNMAGSSLAAAPAYLLGQFCDHVDLDGPSFVRCDISPSVRYRDGLIELPNELWGGR